MDNFTGIIKTKDGFELKIQNGVFLNKKEYIHKKIKDWYPNVEILRINEDIIQNNH